jgi:hypothetical protein
LSRRKKAIRRAGAAGNAVIAGSPPKALPPIVEETVAQQIVDLTRVISDASSAVPGRAITVEVIPGVLPAVPSISQLLQSAAEAGKALDPTQSVQPGAIGGELVSTELPVIDETFQNLQITPSGGLPTTLNGTVEVTPTGELKQTVTAALDGVVSTLSDILEILVGYSVVGANGPLTFGTDYTVLNAVENQLSASVLIRPPFVDDVMLGPAGEFEIVVHVIVRVRLPALAGGAHVEADKTVRIPVVLSAIRVPAVLLVAANRNFGLGDERVAVILRQQSPNRTVSDLVNTLNAVMDVLSGLRMLLPLVPIFNGLSVLSAVLAATPRVYIAFGDVADLEQYGDLRSTHGAVLLFGVEGTQVRFYDDTDFADKTKDVVAPATTLGSLSMPLGFAFHASLYDSWPNNSPESLRWIGPTIDTSGLP